MRAADEHRCRAVPALPALLRGLDAVAHAMAGLEGAPVRPLACSFADFASMIYPPYELASGESIAQFGLGLACLGLGVAFLAAMPFALAWCAERIARTRMPRLASSRSSPSICESKGYEVV